MMPDNDGFFFVSLASVLMGAVLGGSVNRQRADGQRLMKFLACYGGRAKSVAREFPNKNFDGRALVDEL